MLIPTDLHAQYHAAAADDLRVLVVGAGIAGVTIAQLLRRDGRHPVLIERGDSPEPGGYMLGLMPIVDPVLDDLGVHEAYRATSVPLERYVVHGHTGRTLRDDTMAAVLDRFGDYRGIARGALVDALATDGCAVSFDSTVSELNESRSTAEVSVKSAGGMHHLEFDLVVIADGMHSTTRDLVLDNDTVEVVDTDCGGWVMWAAPDTDATDAGAAEEYWGAGFFVGMYPVAGELGVFVSGPRAQTRDTSTFVDRIRRTIRTPDARLARALNAATAHPDAYYWSLTDCRAPVWTTRRTVLLGDAAAGFLPTAGIGAGMAMESAWVLGRMLRRANRSRIPGLIRAYEHAQRPRVEAAQSNSRQLAKVMFTRNRLLATVRDLVLRAVSVERSFRPIQRLLDEQPDPDTLAERALASAR